MRPAACAMEYESDSHPVFAFSARAKRLFYNNFTNRATYRVAVLSSIQVSEPDKFAILQV
jgi:hypothetical protein